MMVHLRDRMSMQAFRSWSIIRDISVLDQPSQSSLRLLCLLGSILLFSMNYFYPELSMLSARVADIRIEIAVTRMIG